MSQSLSDMEPWRGERETWKHLHENNRRLNNHIMNTRLECGSFGLHSHLEDQVFRSEPWHQILWPSLVCLETFFAPLPHCSQDIQSFCCGWFLINSTPMKKFRVWLWIPAKNGGRILFLNRQQSRELISDLNLYGNFSFHNYRHVAWLDLRSYESFSQAPKLESDQKRRRLLFR